MNKLCYVANPLAWESPKGVACRTALHNGYGNVAAMCTSLGIPCHGDGLDLLTEQSKLFTTLATEGPQIAHHLIANSYSLGGVNSSSWIIDELELPRWQFIHQFRYCPDCLQGELINVFQDLYNVSICPLHRTQIVTACPGCHQYEHWTTAHLLFCKCGFDRRSTSGQPSTPYDEKNMDTFGPSSSLNVLSELANVALITQTIWESRKPITEKNKCYLKDEVMNHCKKMIMTQSSRYPCFTRSQHLSAWHSAHPILAKLAESTFKEPTLLNANCTTNACCSSIELDINQVIKFTENCETQERWKILLIRNFTINKHSTSTRYYRCHIPICRFSRALKDHNLNLRMAEKALESNYVSVQHTATLLNCSSVSVQQLVKLGYLNKLIIENKKNENRDPILISKVSINLFLEQFTLVRSIMKLTRTTSTKTVRILNQLGVASAHDKQGLRVYKLSDIYKVQDELKDAASRPSLLYPIALPPTRHLYNTINTYPLDNNEKTSTPLLSDTETSEKTSKACSFTTPDALKYLNITGRLLFHRFVLPGLITPEIINGQRIYSSSEIKKIADHLQTNISLKQAGKTLNLGSYQIKFLINSFNIKPSCKLAYSNGAIQVLYNINDINNLKNPKKKIQIPSKIDVI